MEDVDREDSFDLCVDVFVMKQGTGFSILGRVQLETLITIHSIVNCLVTDDSEVNDLIT